MKHPSAKAEHHNTHYLYSVSTVSETGSTDLNPISDHGSESMFIIFTGNSSAMMNLDARSSGLLALDSLHSTLEFTGTKVQESCLSTVQEALVENQKLTLKAAFLKKNGSPLWNQKGGSITFYNPKSQF